MTPPSGNGSRIGGRYTNGHSRGPQSLRSPRFAQAAGKGRKPGHSVVRLRSGGDRLTFAGDAVFPVGFDRPDWHNGFEHDPEEAARVRVRLLRELAATGEQLVATRLPFPSVGRVAAAGDAFRWVPAFWDY